MSTIMGRVNVVLSDEIEHRLRKALVDMPDYGGKKGDMSKAIEEALDEWIKRRVEKARK
jgi:GTP-binding protein EngB required for normal cell division